MAQEGTQAATEPQQEPPQQQEPDYKALWEAEKKLSAKWEQRAKDNKAALKGAPTADDLAAAQAARDEASAALAKAQAEAEALRAQAAHAEAVAQVAKETGFPEAAVRALRGETADELRASAEALRAQTSVYPLTRDPGEQKPAALTKEAILAIEDRDKRLDAIQRNARLWD